MITDSLAQTCEMTQGTAARPAGAVRVKGARTTHLNTTFAKESSKNLLYQFRSFGNRKSAIAPPLRLIAGVLWSAWLLRVRVRLRLRLRVRLRLRLRVTVGLGRT